MFYDYSILKGTKTMLSYIIHCSMFYDYSILKGTKTIFSVVFS